MNQTGATLLGLFAKYWEPGHVKTRLAATIGDERAAQLHRAFLETLLRRFDGAAARRVLVFSPADRVEAFRDLADQTWDVQPQSAGDLGRRMQAFFETAFAGGAEKAVLLGSDSPTLPRHVMQEAFRRLDQAPVVLGPTADGGYYLIGAAGSAPPVFEGVAWSTPAVWPDTLERLAAAGLSHQVLPRWYDVDEADDLTRLREELADADDRDLKGLRVRIEEIIGELEF